jgi:hypothetical protein
MFDNLIRRDPREQWKDDRQCPADPSKQRWRSRERAARAVRLPAGELDELIPRGAALVGDGIQHVAQLASRTLLVKTGHAIRSRAGFGLAVFHRGLGPWPLKLGHASRRRDQYPPQLAVVRPDTPPAVTPGGGR